MKSSEKEKPERLEKNINNNSFIVPELKRNTPPKNKIPPSKTFNILTNTKIHSYVLIEESVAQLPTTG